MGVKECPAPMHLTRCPLAAASRTIATISSSLVGRRMAAGAHDWFPAQFVQLVRPRIDIESRPYRCTIRTSGSLAEGGGVRSAGGQVPSYRVRAEQEPRGPPRRGCGHGWPRWKEIGRAHV